MNTRTTLSWSQLLQGVLLAGGIAGLWLFASTWLAGVAQQGRRPRHDLESLEITRDGTALIETYVRGEFGGSTYRTLDGKPVDERTTAELNADSSSTLGKAYLPAEKPFRPRPIQWNDRLCGFVGGGLAPVYWYLIHDGQAAGHAYLVGYDGRSNRRIGFLGTTGFQPDLPSDENQFAIDSQWVPNGAVACAREWWGSAPAPDGREESRKYSPAFSHVFIVSAGLLYALDLDQRTVRPIVLPEKAVSVSVAPGPVKKGAGAERRFAVRTTQHITLIKLAGETMQSYAIPPQANVDGICVYCPTGNEVVLRCSSENGPYKTQLFWIGPGAEPARRANVNLTRHAPRDPRHVAWGQAATLPSLATFALARLIITPRESIENGLALSYPAALADSLVAAWPAMIALSVLGLALAVVCYRRQRRYADHGAAAWAAMVFVLGLSGAVGFWLHRKWPTAESCAACGTVVPRDRAECLWCEAAFPEPVARGIEILA